jgi:hypothetical protein
MTTENDGNWKKKKFSDNKSTKDSEKQEKFSSFFCSIIFSEQLAL